MKSELLVFTFIAVFVLIFIACVDRSDDSEEKTANNRIPDLPVNEAAPVEIISPEELQPVITEEDIKRAEQIPLELVSEYSKEEAIAKLAELRIDIGTRQLFDSCLFKSRQLVLLLLKAGVDPNEPASDNRYPIIAACLGGETEIITELIKRGAKLDVTSGDDAAPCIHFAAQSSNTEAVDLMLEHGCNVDDRNNLDRTALMVVCALGMKDMAEYLISCGAEINVKDKNDRGPLYSAVNAGALPVVKLLVEKGADIDTLDKEAGMSPIFAAALAGQEDVFKFLLESGAVLQEEIRNGINIIQVACLSQSQEIVAILLERGFDINEYWDENGGTPLHASLEGKEADREFVKFLVDNGADVNAYNKLGFSPLALAAIRDYADIFSDLLAAGADPKAVNQMGVPLLHFVIMNDNAEMVQTMIDLGVDVFAKDNEGKTALDRSIEYSCQNSERVLREAMGLPQREEEKDKEKPEKIAG